MPATFQERGLRHGTEILRFYRLISKTEAVPRHVAYQMMRAGTAIGANIEEATSAHSRRDLAAKYVIAIREANECRYWLRLIASDRPDLLARVAPLVEECSQLIAMLTVSVKKLRTG